MAQGTLDEAAVAMGGRVIAGEPQALWSGAALDSRAVRGGDLFFALPGERTDGHRFVADALERGAAAAVVRELPAAPTPETGGALVRVDDTYEALHALTRAVRRRLPRRLVAVTGSVGKTTTKELLARILERRFQVAHSPGNLNNLYGFPLALLGIPEGTEWMVAEMGMSTPGELAAISRLGRPEVAVVTNVRPAHLESFGSLRAIAAAKAEILEGLDRRGVLVANADDPEVTWIARRWEGRTVWFGTTEGADLRATDPQPTAEGGIGFTLWRGERRLEVELPLLGRHNVENFLAAAAAAAVCGVEPEVAARAVGGFRAVAGRGTLHRLAGGALLVDDSYNSSPAGLRAALAAAAELPGRRRVAVLGEMLELGETAPSFHRRAGEEAAALGYDLVVGVGELGREIVAGARAGGAAAAWHPDASAAAQALERPGGGDVLLVKGSRRVGLEAVVRSLLGAEAD